MKRLIISSFLLALFFASCRKEDNPKLPDLTRVPVPLITKDASGDDVISGQDPDNFTGKFIVDMFFEIDVKPEKVDVVVIKNGNKTNVRTIQANVTTFPSTIEVTGAQLATLFGEPVVAGNNFEIGADITIGGQTFQAFPVVGESYGAGVAAQPGSSTSIVYVALCGFDKAAFNGNYTVAQDDWADFAVGDLVVVKPGVGANQISVTAYPSPAFGTNRKAMILDVDPVTFVVTVPEQVIGDYTGAPPNATVRGTGTVNPCGDNITLTLTINVAGDDYADNVLILEK
jgi:hypothetical protein